MGEGIGASRTDRGRELVDVWVAPLGAPEAMVVRVAGQRVAVFVDPECPEDVANVVRMAGQELLDRATDPLHGLAQTCTHARGDGPACPCVQALRWPSRLH